MSGHTPGPWVVGGKDIFDSQGGLVAMVTDSYERGKATRARDKADRLLISSAPDLLEALEGAVNQYDLEAILVTTVKDQPWVAAARAAILKARGQS